MQIPNQFTQLVSTPDLTQTIKSAVYKTALELNCVRIGIIKEFYPENLTAKVLIANKKLLGLNADGTQRLTDYPPIFAKVCYCNPFETFPLTKGMECVLLFNDREIESWFINGEQNPQSYQRMHDLTDAVCIAGIRSLPKMIQIITDCLHLFYGSSEIQIKDESIILNTENFDITGNTTQNGTITANNLIATSAASGNLIDTNGKNIAKVVNGIVTEIY